MMRSFRKFVSTEFAFLDAPWFAALFLLALTGLAYGLLFPWLGFYWDEWPMTWIAQKLGPDGLARYFATNRPYWGMIYRVTTQALGFVPWHWQLFGLFWRWMTGLALWGTLRQIWPRQKSLALWASVLFLLYPGFSQQSIGMMFGHFFVVLSAYLLSLLCNLAAVRAWGRKPGRFWLLTVLGLALSLVNLLAMEYFFLLELLRPGFIYLALRNQPENEHETAKNLMRRAAAHWLPYLALFLGTGAWRAFFFPYQHQNYSFGLMDRLKANPIQALLGLAGNVLRDLAQTAVLAWIKPFSPDGFRAAGTRTVLVSAALSLGVMVLALIVLWKAPRADGENKSRRTWAGQALLLGAAGLLLAGPPFWLTGLELHLVYPNDRFTLPFMLGACLVLAGLLALIPGKRILPLLAVSMLAGVSVGLHFREAVSFQRDWNAQKTLFWQMSWRMPGLEPGTTLISSDLPMKYYSDNSLTGPLNWIFAPDNHTQQMAYMFYFASVRSETRALLEPDQPIRQDYLAADFTGSTGQMVALVYHPPACLRVLDAGIDSGNQMLPELMREAAKRSDPRWILPKAQSGPDLTPAIYGQEPAHNWCYYFEKADLARQQGEWQTVSKLGDQAFALNDYPNDPMERLPFIEGYARSGRMDDAKAQTEKALGITPLMKEPLCKLWQRIGQSEQAAGAVVKELGCEP